MLDITQKELEKKVRGFAEMLGVNDRLTSVHINELCENEANCWSITNDYNKCRLELKDYSDVTIVHELLHIVFGNTVDMLHKIEDGTLREIMLMLHEQEVEAFAQTLAKLLKGKEE